VKVYIFTRVVVICVDIRHMVMLRYVWNRKTLLRSLYKGI